KYVVFAYTNGTWFQLTGTETEKDKLSWSFTHCEPFLRRTFKDSTEELKQAIADALADKKKPPEPDTKEKPGFGPEVEPSKCESVEAWERRSVRAWERESAEAREDTLSEALSRSHALTLPRSYAPTPVFAVIPSVAIGGAIAVL